MLKKPIFDVKNSTKNKSVKHFKNILTSIIACFFTVIVFGQTISEVVTVDSTITKETLYSNALSFFATTFKSAQNVIQMKDPESGKVIGKGILSEKRNVTVTISCRDGRYKYDVETDPLIEVKIIQFTSDKCGVLKGTTYLPIYFADGEQVSLNVENAYIENNKNSMSGTWKVAYNGNNFNILGLSKSAIEKWKLSVDEEFKMREKELSNLKAKQDSRLIDFIFTLKKEMAKSDW